MKKRNLGFSAGTVVFFGVMCLSLAAWAQTPTCDGLTGETLQVAQSLLDSEHPYDCCDDTIRNCLKTQPKCSLPKRLANQICRMAEAGKDPSAIRRSLQHRAHSMMRPGRVHEFDLKESPAVGCTKAKVQVVIYTCARCPYCSRLIPLIYKEAVRGRLAGKVSLQVRLFPIKSHDHSTEANVALAAAGRLGRFWEYLLEAYRGFDGFALDRLDEWAKQVGLESGEFEGMKKDKGTRKLLVDAKKEGLKNGVVATPTFFINGRRYTGDLDLEILVDVLEEESEAVGP